MELALSLGDHTSKPFKFLDSNRRRPRNEELGFCMGLGSSGFNGRSSEDQNRKTHQDNDHDHDHQDCPVQLDLLPSSPVHAARRPIHFSWLSDHMGKAEAEGKGLELNRISAEETELSSPNSGATSYQMGYGRYIINNKRETDGERGSSRAISDEEDNGLARKKLRLSKQQSAFLEESFKEHSTLNPKQKLALAKQLNLRPRQVEVWFQNRRARTKLKQTEVDCEYLKRCCETLTEENRRLQKELHELRALKTSQPFFMQLPATTLTMCPSCERVVSTPTTTTTASSTTTTTKNPLAGATASTTPGTSNSTSSSLPTNNPKLLAFSSPAQVN